jgi:hypothetical protein
VLEHDDDLVVLLGEEVRATLLATHRDGDACPERLLALGEPRVLHLAAEARVVLVFLVIDADRELRTTDLPGAKRLGHHAVDWKESHAILIRGAS